MPKMSGGRHLSVKLRQRHANRQHGARFEPPRVKSSHYRTRIRAAEWRD
jgi:hypothetical protein